jgi:type III secretion protein U
MRAALEAAARSGGRVVWESLSLEGTVLTLVAPLLLATGAASAVAMMVQTGGVVAAKRVAPDFGRLDLVRGFRALFSPMRVFSVVRALAAALFVAWMAETGIRGALGDLARLSGRLENVPAVVSSLAQTLAWRAALVGLVLGLLDLLIVRRAWMRRLSMTRAEVKRELQEHEGDPVIKAARQRAHQELLAQVAISSVRTAKVVVVNPTHLACALRYDDKGGDDAPVVVASGEGELAARIVRAAHDYGVPVVRDVPLARALLDLSVGDAIPEALYEAVAEVLREILEHEGPGGEESR